MIEFSVPWQIISSLGTYSKIKDSDSGEYWRPIPDECSAGPDIRVTRDDIPQGDGSQLHPHLLSGYMLRFTLEPMDGGAITVGQTRREMWEELGSHLEALRTVDGRIEWTPNGYAGGNRILDGVRVLEVPKASGGLEKKVTFAVISRFPYYLDKAQDTVALDDTITNDGNAPFAPVAKVHGPVTTGFTLTNNDDVDLDGDPKQIVYDATRPGAVGIASGHYAEIDFFRCTITLDGNISFLSAGIDWAASDFWRVQPGDNDIEHGGDGTADLLVNNAWV